VAAYAREGALHRHVRDVVQPLVVHGFVPPFLVGPLAARRRWGFGKGK
jgi:hypothetical protein